MSRHGCHDQHAHPGLAAVLAAAAVAAFGAPISSAFAQLPVELDHVDATEVADGGNGNSVIDPGERAAITPHVVYSDFTPLEDLAGTLAPATDTLATLEQGAAAWPVTSFGVPTASTTPFVALVDPAHVCGVPLRFTLTLSSSVGGGELPVTVSTGSASDAATVETTDLAVPIPDNGGAVEQRIVLDTPGRVRSLRVRTTSLSHSYSGDLRITVVAPDGRSVLLADRRGGSAANAYEGTVFSDGASTDIRWATAPFGQVRPEQPLGDLDGAVAAGTWTLRVEDRSLGGTGVLGSWAIAAPTAVCGTTEEPPPPPPEPLKPGNGNGQGHGYALGLGLNGPRPGNSKK